MRDVAIIGVGMTPVGEHWQSSLRMLAAEAIQEAVDDAKVNQVDALYVGNAYGASSSSQSQLGALIADHAGLKNVEAYSMDAAGASGGAALRTGFLAVASGTVDTVLVVGVEKLSDSIAGSRIEAHSVSLDADYEASHGATLTALAALLMRRYMHEFQVAIEAFEGFSINAHANGKLNKFAMFQNTIKPGAFSKAPIVADPVNLFDSAPDADGAAALILTSAERAADMVSCPIHIAGSAVSSDTFALQDRSDPLFLRAIEQSAQKALNQAGLTTHDIDLFELYDAYTILSVLTLEATGFAERGKGWTLADTIDLAGKLPISTFGGLKSRGNPVGAAGVYQAVEAVLQLRGEAASNQVSNASIAMIQCLGGLASTAITHILSA